jgi:hypothetical protein
VDYLLVVAGLLIFFLVAVVLVKVLVPDERQVGDDLK